MAALQKADDDLWKCSMNRTDPFFLESRPLLIASREILDSFLQRLADESIDISELHLGYAEDAATLAYGTATRFYLLARKQLRAERGCSDEDIDEEDALQRGAKLCTEALQHRATYNVAEYRAAAASVLSQEGEGEASREEAPAGNKKMQNQIRAAQLGTFAPSGVTKEGIPLFLFRPNGEHFVESCSERFVADLAPGDGGEDGPWPEQDFASALMGTMDHVYRTQVVAQSKAQGKIVDRLTILVDCGGADLFMLAEIHRLCTPFFKAIHTVYAETTDSIYLLNLHFIIRGPAGVLVDLFADEEVRLCLYPNRDTETDPSLTLTRRASLFARPTDRPAHRILRGRFSGGTVRYNHRRPNAGGAERRI
jgi:hypothetical protein